MASSSPNSGSNSPPLASKQAAYRIASSHLDIAGDALLERAVQIRGAADEAHRGHAEAMAVERRLGRGDQLRMVGKAQVVVGAEIEHLARRAVGATRMWPTAATGSAARSSTGFGHGWLRVRRLCRQGRQTRPWSPKEMDADAASERSCRQPGLGIPAADQIPGAGQSDGSEQHLQGIADQKGTTVRIRGPCSRRRTRRAQ